MRLRENPRPPRRYEGNGTYTYASPSDTDQDHELDSDCSSTDTSSQADVDLRASSLASPTHRVPSSPRRSDGLTLVHCRNTQTNMANIKYYNAAGQEVKTNKSTNKRKQPQSKQSQSRSQEQLQTDDMERGRKSHRHPLQEQRNTEDLPAIHAGRAAAFPSLMDPLDEPEVYVGRHGIYQLMEERFSGETLKWKETFGRGEKQQANKHVFEGVDPELASAYQVDMDEMASSVEDVEPSKITFRSLYPSLRQVIILEIMEEGKHIYESQFYPVISLLDLTREELDEIMGENDSLWDDLPPHLERLRRANPGLPINPDTPPDGATAIAARFLRQEKLPTTLLGEWEWQVNPNARPSLPPTTVSPIPGESSKTSVGVNESIDPYETSATHTEAPRVDSLFSEAAVSDSEASNDVQKPDDSAPANIMNLRGGAESMDARPMREPHVPPRRGSFPDAAQFPTAPNKIQRLNQDRSRSDAEKKALAKYARNQHEIARQRETEKKRKLLEQDNTERTPVADMMENSSHSALHHDESSTGQKVSYVGMQPGMAWMAPATKQNSDPHSFSAHQERMNVFLSDKKRMKAAFSDTNLGNGPSSRTPSTQKSSVPGKRMRSESADLQFDRGAVQEGTAEQPGTQAPSRTHEEKKKGRSQGNGTNGYQQKRPKTGPSSSVPEGQVEQSSSRLMPPPTHGSRIDSVHAQQSRSPRSTILPQNQAQPQQPHTVESPRVSKRAQTPSGGILSELKGGGELAGSHPFHQLNEAESLNVLGQYPSWGLNDFSLSSLQYTPHQYYTQSPVISTPTVYPPFSSAHSPHLPQSSLYSSAPDPYTNIYGIPAGYSLDLSTPFEGTYPALSPFEQSSIMMANIPTSSSQSRSGSIRRSSSHDQSGSGVYPTPSGASDEIPVHEEPYFNVPDSDLLNGQPSQRTSKTITSPTGMSGTPVPLPPNMAGYRHNGNHGTYSNTFSTDFASENYMLDLQTSMPMTGMGLPASMSPRVMNSIAQNSGENTWMPFTPQVPQNRHDPRIIYSSNPDQVNAQLRARYRQRQRLLQQQQQAAQQHSDAHANRSYIQSLQNMQGQDTRAIMAHIQQNIGPLFDSEFQQPMPAPTTTQWKPDPPVQEAASNYGYMAAQEFSRHGSTSMNNSIEGVNVQDIGASAGAPTPVRSQSPTGTPTGPPTQNQSWETPVAPAWSPITPMTAPKPKRKAIEEPQEDTHTASLKATKKRKTSTAPQGTDGETTKKPKAPRKPSAKRAGSKGK